MGEIEIIELKFDLSEIDNFNFHESTFSESIKDMESSRSNPFLKVILSGAIITGAALIGPNSVEASDFNSLSQNLIEHSIDVEQFLENYKTEIERSNNPDDLVINNGILTKQDIVKRILSFKALCENWDGHNAYPLEVECASNALFFVDLLGESNLKNVNEIYPNPNGTITFEWNNQLEEVLNVEIGQETMSYYVEISGKDVVYSDQKVISSNEAQKVIKYISVL